MKKISFALFMGSSLLLTSCVKEKTTIVESDGDKTTIEHLGIDNEKLDSTVQNIEKDAKAAGQDAKITLDKVGDAIKDGSKDLQSEAKKATADAAEAVEKGAKDVKESVSKD